MVRVFAEAGVRAVAPDLVGFGRSDKPTDPSAYTYQAHVDWMATWLEAVDLRGVTLVCQDWGSLIGLRLVAEHPDRFARVVVANGFLPTADRPTPRAFHVWRAFALHSPVLPVGRIVDVGTRRKLSPAERKAYDAPFPGRAYKVGARRFPALVPTSPDDPAVPANRAAWAELGRWDKPFLTLFGAGDPILGRADRALQEHVPGAAGQPHARVQGGHFVQEDAGEEIARRVVDWIA
jgi:haloalkane dehalogenase